MQKYIYGNVGHTGFTYVSSDRDFFYDEKGDRRRTALHPMQRYDKTDGQSYWMVTTNLGIPGEEERIIVQISGADPFRDGIYMQGYMTDPGEATFGPEMLQLLRIRFQGLGAAMAEADGGVLYPVPRDQLPLDDRLRPAQVNADLMENILLALLNGRRVILRIPETGPSAASLSREMLLSIYQRLPYECRRLNGFLTGASQAVMLDWENPLPDSITVVLMDGDTDISELSSDRYQQVIDLAGNRGTAPVDRVKNAAYMKLLDFLAEEKPEVLNEFFRLCKDFSDAETDGGGLKLSEYSLLLDMFNSGREEMTPPRIRMWAASLYKNRWSEKTNEMFYRRVAQDIPPEKMRTYLTNSLSNFGDLKQFGLLGDQDKGNLRAYGSGQEEILDQNEALTLGMTEALLSRGIYPQTVRAEIVSALTGRFAVLACEEYPCLAEKRPTAATVSQLDQLKLPPEESADDGQVPVFREVRRTVYQKMREERERIKAFYRQQYTEQQQAGFRLIGQWPTGNWQSYDLDELYRQLRKFYLCEELFEGDGQNGWNRKIAEWIMDACICPGPRTLENIRSALEHANYCGELFLQNGGHFTPDQDRKRQERTHLWQEILALNESKCGSVAEMLALFDKIRLAELEEKTESRLLSKYAGLIAVLPPEADEICRLAPELVRRSGSSPKEKELFPKIIAASADLNVITEGMGLDQTESRLKSVQLLADAGLTDERVWFRAWQEKGAAEQFISRIDALRNYREGKSVPELDNERIRNWAAESLQNNSALLFLMARKYPSMRERLIEVLAQKSHAVNAKRIAELYIAGCPRALLRRGAGKRTSPAWAEAVEDAFPSWCDLPAAKEKEPESRPNMAERVMLAAGPMLLGLAALVPPVSMTQMGGSAAVGSIIAAAVEALFGIGLCVAGLLVREKEQKRFSFSLALSLLPGFIFLLVQLILNLI